MKTIDKFSKLRVLFLVVGALIFITSCCPDDDCETITCELPEPDPSDIINLGILNDLTSLDLSYDLSTNTSDNTIIYSFIVQNTFIPLDHLIKTEDNVQLTVRDEANNVITSGENLITNRSPYDFIEASVSLPVNTMLFLELKNLGSSDANGYLEINIKQSRYTDIYLGNLSTFYNEAVDFGISQEPDDKQRIVFEISYPTLSYSFGVVSDHLLTLYNQSGEVLGDSLQSILSGSVLMPGTYEIEILNDKPYIDSIGELIMDLYPNTDVDLGAIEPPYRESFAVSISDQEQDHKLVYSFSILDYASYFIHIADENVQLILKDNQGTTIASGNSFIANSFRNFDATNGEDLELGTTYYLEVIDTTGVGVHANLDITLRRDFETDLDLGILAVPYTGTYDFEIANGEPDKAIGISFEIENAAMITVPGISNVMINLFNGDGQYIDRALDANETISLNLAAGEYRFDIITDQFDPAIYEQLSITLTPQ